MPRQRKGPIEGTPAEAAVLTTVLTNGPVARAEIARLTGLSSPAITRAVKPLLDAGYLEYDEAAEPLSPDEARLGRPSRPLRIRALHTGSVGIKITGDELIGVVCDLAGTPRVTKRRALARHVPHEVIAQVASLHGQLLTAAERVGFALPPRHLGITLSGEVDHETGYVRYSPFLRWHHVDLGRTLSAELGLPVVVENDVKALTIAEKWFGLGRGVANFAVVTVGAGIGCALVVDDALVRGAHSVAGEIGHLPLGDRSVLCHCGAHGCVEAQASTTALEIASRRATGRDDLTFGDAVESARAGDPAVMSVFADAGALIGRALASVANLLGPEQIIVAGEGVATYDLFETAIREAFTEHAFGAALRVAVHVRDLPFEEWARGAAAMAIEAAAFPSWAPATGSRRVNGDSVA
ncbi:ROK family transcriptional regulator [Streptosporangium sp. NPDC048047]|uniref:ROK family transcriptional regulator n=1 Tax=Streptosporangium sp. NPDC048047 TaxID=3155748 RepID=UPI003449B8C6